MYIVLSNVVENTMTELENEVKNCIRIFPYKDRMKYDQYFRGLCDAYNHLGYSLNVEEKKWWKFW